MAKDKGMAPSFREQSEVGDGENINIAADAQGRAVTIFSTGDNLTQKGQGNYTGPFKNVVGKSGLLPDKGPQFVNENRERPETDDDDGMEEEED